MNMILTRVEGGIATLTLNNRERRNAICQRMVDEINTAVENFQREKIRVVILRAESGAKVWSAGHDINELPIPGRDPLGYADSLLSVIRTVQNCSMPVIAMIEGAVWGGACDLAMSCDILIGSPTASFSMTPAKIGVPYNASGILHFMGIMGVNIAKEIFFSAQPMSAMRAERLGILNHLVPQESFESFTYDLANKIAQNSPLCISVIKEQIRLLASAHPLNPHSFERIQGLRRLVYDSKDYMEGIKAFHEKRKPQFTGN